MCISIAVLDTGPHVPSTFVYGNNFWFTSAGLCDLTNEPLPISLSAHLPHRMHANLLPSASPVRMEPRMLYANYTDGMQVDFQFQIHPTIHIGLCVPASCSDRQVFWHTQAFLNRRQLIVQEAFDIDLTVIAGKTMNPTEYRVLRSISFYLML